MDRIPGWKSAAHRKLELRIAVPKLELGNQRIDDRGWGNLLDKNKVTVRVVEIYRDDISR